MTWESSVAQEEAEKRFFAVDMPNFLNRIEFILKDKKFVTGDKVPKFFPFLLIFP